MPLNETVLECEPVRDQLRLVEPIDLLPIDMKTSRRSFTDEIRLISTNYFSQLTNYEWLATLAGVACISKNRQRDILAIKCRHFLSLWIRNNLNLLFEHKNHSHLAKRKYQYRVLMIISTNHIRYFFFYCYVLQFILTFDISPLRNP